MLKQWWLPNQNGMFFVGPQPSEDQAFGVNSSHSSFWAYTIGLICGSYWYSQHLSTTCDCLYMRNADFYSCVLSDTFHRGRRVAATTTGWMFVCHGCGNSLQVPKVCQRLGNGLPGLANAAAHHHATPECHRHNHDARATDSWHQPTGCLFSSV